MAKVILPIEGTIRFPLPMATLYVDGSCYPNPGPGAWGVVIEKQYHAIDMEMSGISRFTTVSRMELQAAIEALRALPGHYQVCLYSDSEHVVEGITKYIHAWVARGWKNSQGEQVKNYDLWAELFYVNSAHIVTWEWRPRNSLPKMERAHQLASEARRALVETLPKVSTPILDHPPVLVVDETVHITAAASCSGNPGPGIWAAILNYKGHTKEVVGRETATTSNRMQLMACIAGLEAIKQPGIAIVVYTNSEYITEGIKKSLYQAMPNYDLWKRLSDLNFQLKPTWKHENGPDFTAAKRLTRTK